MSFIRSHQVDPGRSDQGERLSPAGVGNEERWTQLAQRWARCFDRGGANHKPLLEMLTVDSLQWIAPI